MANLISQLLPTLEANRLQGLDLGPDFIYPAYDGRSILNIPDTVCRLFQIPEIGAGALAEDYLSPLNLNDGEIRKVVLVLVDALGLRCLQRWLSEGTAPVWDQLAQDGILAPLTSITPSTTSAALTTLWTGHSAAVHGITGYEMWMKEYGVVANTILHAPSSFDGGAGSLRSAGFDPATYLNVPTLGRHLAVHGIESRAVQHYTILNSGLSEMFFADVERQPLLNAPDLWINVRRLLETKTDKRLYTWVYWSAVDTLSHRQGPYDERVQAEFASFSAAFQNYFLERLSPEARQNTLLILTADHGQISTPPDPHYDLNNHPSLTRRLHMMPTGEHRFAYLYVRPGQTEAVREYIQRTWPNQLSVVESAYAAQNGLFGPGPMHPRLLERIGDYIVIARGDAYLWWEEKENNMRGRHGGLHPEEMLVPFLAVRL